MGRREHGSGASSYVTDYNEENNRTTCMFYSRQDTAVLELCQALAAFTASAYSNAHGGMCRYILFPQKFQGATSQSTCRLAN